MDLKFEVLVGNQKIKGGVDDASQATRAAAADCAAKSSEASAAYETQLCDIETDEDIQTILLGHSTTIDKAQQEINTQQDNIAIAKNNLTTQENLKASLETSIASAEGQKKTVEGQIKDLESKSSTLDGDEKSALDAQIKSLKAQQKELEAKIKQMGEDKDKAQGNIDKLNADIDGYGVTISNCQREIEDANRAIAQLEEQNDFNNESEISKLTSERDSAMAAASGTAENIRAQAVENEKQKSEQSNEEEGFDYSKVDGEIFSDSQLNNEIHYDKEKVEELNRRLTELGFAGRIDTSDGLSASEINTILALNGYGNFSENDKLSSSELKSVLETLGVDNEFINSLSVDSNSYTIKTEGNAVTGLQIGTSDALGLENSTKRWKAYYNNDGSIASSFAEYTNYTGLTRNLSNVYYTEDDKIKKVTNYTDNVKEVTANGDYDKNKTKELRRASDTFSVDSDKVDTSDYSSFYSAGVLSAMKEEIENLIPICDATNRWTISYNEIINDTNCSTAEKISKLQKLKDDYINEIKEKSGGDEKNS